MGRRTCTCCRCQFSNWTFVINFNGSPCPVQFIFHSVPKCTQCTQCTLRWTQQSLSIASCALLGDAAALRFATLRRYSALRRCCSALLCFVAAHAVVIYVPLVSFFAFSWLLSMRLFIVVGVSCCGCGKVAFAIVVICQLIARCSAHSALVSVGSVQRLSLSGETTLHFRQVQSIV